MKSKKKNLCHYPVVNHNRFKNKDRFMDMLPDERDKRIRKLLRSKARVKDIEPFLPYLNTYILTADGNLDRDALTNVLKFSGNKKAIKSIVNLKKYLDEYVHKEDGNLDHDALGIVLKSSNKQAVEIITPYLDRLDQYIFKDGSLNAEAIQNILFSRCKKPIEKIISYLDKYIMPIPRTIVLERIESVLYSHNSLAINKIFTEGHLTAYIQSSSKPYECLNKLKVRREIKQRIREDLNISKNSHLSSISRFDTLFKVIQQPENSIDAPEDDSISIADDSIPPSLDSFIDPAMNNLPQLTGDDVAHVLGNRFPGSTIFLNVAQMDSDESEKGVLNDTIRPF
jgi:hypothetical protein